MAFRNNELLPKYHLQKVYWSKEEEEMQQMHWPVYTITVSSFPHQNCPNIRNIIRYVLINNWNFFTIICLHHLYTASVY